MKTLSVAPVVLLLCMALVPAHAQLLPAAPLGKQRAAASKLEWEVRDAGHPILGSIRFAYLKSAVETPVGNAKVFSRAYLSCQRSSKRYAIELSNATAPDDPKGLRPATDPRLYCNRPIQPWDEKLIQEELLVRWDVNELGDALTQGLRPFPLRECVSIRVVQEVALPQGWGKKSARVEFDILPYNKEVDSVFATCGELSAYGPTMPPMPVATAAAPAPAPASAPAAPAKPAPAPTPPAAAPSRPAAIASAPVTTPPKPAAETAAPWQTARTIAGSRTNVRAGPNLQAAVVAELSPGFPVMVQRTGTEWWRAKSTEAPAFEGFIRQDRLAFK